MENKKKKNLPLLLMLLAGIISWTITFIFQYTLISKLIILLCVLFIFYCVGLLIVAVLTSFEKEQNIDETEKVIEKELEKEEEKEEEEEKKEVKKEAKKEAKKEDSKIK